MPREARFPSRPAWFRAVFGLGLGVLLCGCNRPSAGAGHAPATGPSATHVPQRVGTHIASQTGQERVQYAVKADATLTRLDVSVCPIGFRIERLNAPSPGAQQLLAGGHIVTPEGDVSCPDEGADLPTTRADECVTYAVEFPTRKGDPTSLRRVGDDLLASPDWWLWVPTPRPLGAALRVHFELPAGVFAALPWPSENGLDFAVPESAFAWKSAGAFGHAPLEVVDLPHSQLRIASLGGGFGLGDAAVRAWIAQGARTSSLLFGAFPVPRALVIAVPGERTGPAFGMALRGGGPAVVIFLNQSANAASLADDWTATHEF